MNDSVTLNNTQAILANIPKFPQVKPWVFNRNINVLSMNNALDDKFNASGMLGKGKNTSQYGIADVSDYLGNNNGDTIQIPNDEYMSRQTGIPRDVYKKFRQHTNNARASLPYDAQALAPLPSVINIKVTNDTDGGSYSFAGDRLGRFLPYVLLNNGSLMSGVDTSGVDRAATLQYNGFIKPPRIEEERFGNGTGIIRIRQRENPTSIRTKWNKYIKNRNKDTTAFYDVLKHEVAHQNTAKNTNDIFTNIPGVKSLLGWYGNFKRNHPIITIGSPKIPLGVERDLTIDSMYDSFSPRDAFRQDTYFNEPAEAWGAANRVKNDGAGLFYKKYGRLPGFNDLGEPITGAQKVNDIKEAIKLFNQENPGKNTLEHMRIKNLETSPADMSEWMLSTPYENWYIDQANPGITMWDLVHSNTGRMNKIASANISGLHKAASEVKEAGKIMKVKVSKQMRGKYGWRGMAQFIYMPDCKKYRDIISNGSGEQQAELANKFILNQKPDMVWTSCKLEIVEK